MNKRHHTKIVREGKYIAEVEVELIDSDEGWSPICRSKTPISWTMFVSRSVAAISEPPRGWGGFLR